MIQQSLKLGPGKHSVGVWIESGDIHGNKSKL